MGQAYTEANAGEKWCPFTRVATTEEIHQGLRGVVAVNRLPSHQDPFAGSRCVGSLCSQWCWMTGSRGAERKGYCGLSGEPKT